jgi:hypothetical protein
VSLRMRWSRTRAGWGCLQTDVEVIVLCHGRWDRGTGIHGLVRCWGPSICLVSRSRSSDIPPFPASATILPGALERLGQQRVREHLARDPLRVQRVGLPALARAIVARGAVRAHVADVIATPCEEHGGVASPARGALHAPAGDRPELPGPRLHRAMPVTCARAFRPACPHASGPTGQAIAPAWQVEGAAASVGCGDGSAHASDRRWGAHG